MGARSQSEEKRLTERELAALRHIRKALVHGRSPSIRDLQAALSYQSPNGAAYILGKLEAAGFLRRRDDGRLQMLRDVPEESTNAHTVDVPLVGIAPCGAPLLAEENFEAMVPVSVLLARPPYHYFLIRAQGDSMNLAGILDGELVLVRQQSTAKNGDRVVALIDDEATIKEFRQTKDAIALVPRSSKKTYKPIILTSQFMVQGVVQATVPNLEGISSHVTKEHNRRSRRGGSPRTLDR
jgi:repressor LexA